MRGGCYAKRVIIIDDKHTNLSTPHAHLVALHVPVEPTAEQHTLKSVGDYIKHTAL